MFNSMKLSFLFMLFCCCGCLLIPRVHCGVCPKGWKNLSDSKNCFLLVSNAIPWDKAEATCGNHNGHLASLTTAQELKYMQTLCRNVSNGCWVGGHGVNSHNGFDWKWSDPQHSWNKSVFPGAPSSLSCSNTSCLNANLTEFCTLVTNGHVALVGERCNTSHEFVCMLRVGIQCQHSSCHKEYIIIIVAVSGFLLVATMSVVIWLLAFRQNKRRRRSRKSSSPATAALVPPSWKVYTSEELKSITKNFSEVNRLLGDAKIGGTYRGTLPDGTFVAVKRLQKSSFQSKKEFVSEIGRIARLSHPNLVSVKGCCYEHGDRYVVYEFVANGPLNRWLHHLPKGGRSLGWGMRMRVATTLAQGIAFLHDKVKPHVVHGDIRASNVLVDEDFGAHILGVGLSKFVPWEGMHQRTAMAGAHGYLAPEFVYRNELTTKSDVYSFRVLLLELISGRKPAQTIETVEWQSIFEWATPLVQSHRYVELLDPVITDIPDAAQIQKVVDLVYTCTQHVPSMRPRMSYVVHQLQQLELKVTSATGRVVAGSSSTVPLEVESAA